MISSGIKRGLATTAISALAVTGLPFLATSASADPIASTFTDPDEVAFYAPIASSVSAKNDGTNTTVSLVVGGGSNVTAVLFQYQTTAGGATWFDVPGGQVARNTDGVFGLDWTAPPADLTAVRAVPNTEDSSIVGPGNTVETDTQAVTNSALTADTVELASEGSIGVFQEPYTETAGTQELVGVTGTVSQGTTDVTVTDVSHGTTGVASATTVETTADTASDTFNSVVDIDGYPYAPGPDDDQIALNGNAVGPGTNTDDAEGSTLYVQTIGSITATPETQEDASPGDAEVTLTVLDTTGKPVAGAQVGRVTPDPDGAGPTADPNDVIVGTTDGRGQITDTPGATGTYTYYANTTDTDNYESGTDPADTATITTYTPALAAVDIVNERNHANFDTDELADDDDFTIETRDQRGNLFDEAGAATPEYRWVIDPSGTGTTETTVWRTAVDIAPAGTYRVDGPEQTDYPGGLPDGTYTLEARRPNVSGTGLTNAAPEVVQASESEITFDEGADANAPIEGETTINGTLANDAGGLGGREVTISYGGAREDSQLAPQAEQPAGVTRTSATTATVITNADGTFAVKLEDPAGPVVVADNPEDATLTATATGEDINDVTNFQNGAYGKNDAILPNEDASASVVVHWDAPADIAAIEVTMQELDGQAAPGRPVDFDITVREEDGVNDGNTGNNPVAQDFDVEVSVDKGFLTPNAEVVNDLDLADGHDAVGDLWGFFKNDGTSETVSTGDTGSTGIVAAIERDVDFDDDGLATATVTITAGDQTVTKTIEWDATNVLNLVEGDLDPADGEPSGQVSTDEEVDFQLYTFDQFENLVGDRFADVSDDSTVADFRTDGDFGSTLTDFVNDGAGITAFSDAPTTQTLTARVSGNESLVGPNESQATDGGKALPVSSDPIEWVEPAVEIINAGLTLRGGDNGAADDSLFANAHRQTEGAVVKLFRKRADGTWKLIRKGVMNAEGNFRFKNVNDKNGNGKTRYKAVVKATEDTRRGVGKKTVR